MVLGLNQLPHVRLEQLPRLADFACWATACETAFTEPGGVMAAFTRNMAEAVHSVIEGDAVCVALLALLDAHANHWRGKPEALLELIGAFAPDGAKRERDFPRNPQTLSNRLRLAAPSLRKIGVSIDRGKTHGDRWIDIARA